MASADRLIEVFNEAKARPAGAERERFLAEACPEDAALKAQVVALLQAHMGAGDFLKPTLFISPPSLLTEKPGDKIGRYKLLQQVGEGGCGVVYMAEQEEPVRRRVALKVIKLGMDTKQVIARFEAERQALALMDHPNIAKVLDAGATETGRPYFVMELVRGIKITDYCDQNNLSTTERLKLFTQVCQAIQHAHQKGIIHRDIKPSNVLVTVSEPGAPGCPKVIDFGIAKATTGQRLTDKTVFTAFEQFIGTPAYMSPEQAMLTSLDIDTRTDIYALGVLLYELLTGQTPFDTNELLQSGLDAMRRTIREQEPVKPSTRLSLMLEAERTTTAKHHQTDAPKLVHLVSGDLDWIVMKCLEKDRTRRYETANGLAADVQRHLNNEPVNACPPSAIYRLHKAVRRNKTAFTAAAVIATVLVLGVVASTLEAIRATRAERIAVTAQHNESQQRLKADASRAEEARQRGIASEQEMLARRRFYAAQMNLANQAWEARQLARTIDLLDTLRPRSLEPDLRSFEWFYLWGLCNGRLLHTIRAHTDTVLGVAFSPDGNQVASVSGNGNICLSDTANGRQSLLLKPIANVGMDAIAFSPDGKTIASGDREDLVHLWEVPSGKLLATLPGHPVSGQPVWVRSLAFSPDGKFLASGDDPDSDGVSVKIWDLATDQVLSGLKGNKGAVTSIAFSPDGSTLATGSDWGDDGGSCLIWSLTNGTPKRLANLGKILRLSFAPDGKTLAATSWSEIQLWDATTWKQRSTLKGHIGPVQGISFLPDGHSLVSCGVDRTIRLWEWPVDDWSKAVCRVIGAHLDAATCLAVTRDGGMMATGGNDGTVRLWNISEHDQRQDSRLSTEFKFGDDGGGHNLESVLPLPDRKRVLVVTQDGSELRDLTSGRKLASWPEAAGRGALSPDGKLLATCNTKDGALKLWDVATERLIASVKPEDAKTGGGTPVLAFSPDGRTLASGWSAGTEGPAHPIIRLWDVAAGLKVLPSIDTSAASIDALSFSPDGKTLAASPGQSSILLFDGSTGQAQGSILTSDSMLIVSIAFSPDNRILAAAREGGVLGLWDTQTGELLKELKGHASTVRALAFSPDGGTLASGGADGTVRLWDVLTGQERVSLTCSNSVYEIMSLAFPDTSTLIIGSRDGSVSIRRGIHNPEADFGSVPIEQSSEARAYFLKSRVDSFARRAQWQAAVSTATGLMESDPAGDVLYRLATLLVVSKDLTGYRQLCPAILKKFKGTTDPLIASRAAKACLILPSSGVDLEAVAVLADTAAREGAALAELPWFQLTKGLAEYRLWHFTNSLEWAQKVALGENPRRDAVACAILAMANYRLRQFDEARSALAKGEDINDTKLPSVDSGDLGEDWRNWIIAHALMTEAKALIEGQTNSATTEKTPAPR